MKKRFISSIMLILVIFSTLTDTTLAMANTLKFTDKKDISSYSDNKLDIEDTLRRSLRLTGTGSSFIDWDAASLYKLKLKSFENNGGGHIEDAFDGERNWQWISEKENTVDFKNEVIVTFEQLEIVKYIIYDRQAYSTGEPLRLSIYGSKEDTGDNFELMAQGNAQVDSARVVKYSFEEFEAKRVKIVYDSVRGNKASAYEINFYTLDPFEEIVNWFSDTTFSELNKKDLTLQDINDKRAMVEAYPDFEFEWQGYDKKEYFTYLDIAEHLVNDPDFYKEDVVNIRSDGNKESYNKKMGLIFSNDFQTTGIVAKPRTEIYVFVSASDSVEGMPEIVFTQQTPDFDTSDSSWCQNQKLYRGYNKITVPVLDGGSLGIKGNPGGPVYIEYTFKTDVYNPINIRIQGGDKYPLYKESVGKEKFLENLIAYKDLMDKDPTTVDIMEIDTDHAVINDLASTGYRAYIEGGVDVDKNAYYWDRQIKRSLDFFGIQKEDLPYMKTHLSMGAHWQNVAWGALGRTIYPYDANSSRIYLQDIEYSSDWNHSVVDHEVAHQLEQSNLRIIEITTDITRNIFTSKYLGTNWLQPRVYAGLYDHILSADTFESLNQDVKRLMFVQLETFYQGLWTKLNRKYIDDSKKGILEIDENSTRETKYIRMVRDISIMIGIDVSSHFKRYKFIDNDVIVDGLEDLPKLDVPLWYSNTGEVYHYKGSGFTENADAKIVSASGKKLILSIDKSQEEHFLGYEVYKDGDLIGFTYTNEFNNSTNILDIDSYKVKAVDKKLKIQEKYVGDFPTFSGKEDISILEGTLFNPLQGVLAEDTEDGDITKDINITGSVDTNLPGKYEL
ncbi:MAG: DUF5011 domain-containing protein, partial [Oscillospiraceae bacterium]|nr:DUF5011 domain-containing protein [Oscillospiraceae bacterium]